MRSKSCSGVKIGSRNALVDFDPSRDPTKLLSLYTNNFEKRHYGTVTKLGSLTRKKVHFSPSDAVPTPLAREHAWLLPLLMTASAGAVAATANRHKVSGLRDDGIASCVDVVGLGALHI